MKHKHNSEYRNNDELDNAYAKIVNNDNKRGRLHSREIREDVRAHNDSARLTASGIGKGFVTERSAVALIFLLFPRRWSCARNVELVLLMTNDTARQIIKIE
jgi:hypothetical protein